MAAPAPAALASTAAAVAAPGGPAETESVDLAIIKSPIVGTFYRAPEPGAPNFVEVGDTVRKGQVLCIIEAMKLMNEIECDTEGEVAVVHVENGRPVQFGDRLYSIKVSGR
jgi:acetyl-CoA carboxylase biotin carboxyl carrier protein